MQIVAMEDCKVFDDIVKIAIRKVEKLVLIRGMRWIFILYFIVSNFFPPIVYIK